MGEDDGNTFLLLVVVVVVVVIIIIFVVVGIVVNITIASLPIEVNMRWQRWEVGEVTIWSGVESVKGSDGVGVVCDEVWIGINVIHPTARYTSIKWYTETCLEDFVL